MFRISDRPAINPGVVFVLLITLWRIVMLAFNRTELYVDESQYWFWGQNLDFGYYSKPPMIAWVIRAVTDLAGSSSPFWVRFPAPLFHMGTAMLLMYAARRLFDVPVSNWVGPVYVLLPMATLGSALFSTDTIMLFFYALALLAWLQLQSRRSVFWAGMLGAAVGFGMLSKYAMIYFVIGAILAAFFVRGARISWRDAAIAAALALVMMSPNIWWNLQTGGTTLQHTVDNASWSGARAGLHFRAMLQFLAGQFAVFGPILFAAYLLRLVRAPFGQKLPHEAMLLWLSAPVIAMMMVQALMSRANANWGVTAYIGGTLLVTCFLWQRGRYWLYASQALHLAAAIALPLILLHPGDLRRENGGRQYLARYLNRAETSLKLAQLAKDNGLDTIVSKGRELAADLHYTLRNSDLKLYSLPRSGFPASYYEQEFAVPGNYDRPVLFAGIDNSPDCARQILFEDDKTDGVFTGHKVIASIVDPACLQSLLEKGR